MRSANQPKYLKFADEIRQRVRAGELKAGDRLPSLTEAREQRGMGRSTLERAHALLEKDGLIVREHGRGTFITQPRRITNDCIGFFRHADPQALRYPFWNHLIDGMQAAATRAGMEITLLNPVVDAIRWEKIDAVVVPFKNFSSISNLLPVTMPCVSLMHHVPGVSSVVADEYSGVHDAIHHLASLGHRNIGYLTFKHPQESPLRIAAYAMALREAGIEPQTEWVRELAVGRGDAPDFFVGLGRYIMKEWLSNGFRETGCTALLMQNDETALGAVEALRAAGYAVPGDISIVGFDGTEVAEYCSPPLTTVVMPLREMGAKAVELLVETLREEGTAPAAQTVTLPTYLKVRETTLAPSLRAT